MDVFKAKNILIIRLSSLGDVLLTTPIVRSIKKLNPGTSIDFIVQKEFLEVYQNNPHLRNCFSYNKQKRQLTESIFFSIKNYDLIIDLQNNRRSKEIISDFNGVVNRFRKSSLKKILLVKTKINLMKNLPPIPDRYAECAFGLELDEYGLEIFDKNKNLYKQKSQKNIIGICPGSKHYTKMWNADYFTELANNLLSIGYEVAIIGGSSDKTITDKILNSNRYFLDFTTKNNLLETADNLSKCKLVVCNDSGLMHLASAVQIPLIAIFGSTVREFGFTPYKCTNLVLENNLLNCRPCSHIGKSRCPKKHFKCMLEIKPEFVLNKIEEMLRD